ncbi:MAG: sugar phosphate isomerase/epimerase [Verrucomicrobiae bacterium]|nr:sugar phosphate isomerase/epimerase [Verrucomicrobiae bacterium]
MNQPSSESSSRAAMSRRDLLSLTGMAAAGVASAGSAHAATAPEVPGRFLFSLNMSTIRGQELDAAEEIEVAGKAGYDAIEPWFRKISEYTEKGGSLKELKKRIDDHGLKVTSAIGFAPWIVNDPDKRAAGFEEAKRDMDTIAQLGGTRIAAPPAGVGKDEVVILDDAAVRYRQLLELGDEMGVTPQVEMWGGNPTIGTMEKALYVAVGAEHPGACFLGDVYHIYKGGSSFDSLLLLGPKALQNFHMNDYPADPPRETIKDAHRVFPGDGIAPITEILKHFKTVDAWPVLSLELFNADYWAMDALDCARTGLEKMKAAVAAAE